MVGGPTALWLINFLARRLSSTLKLDFTAAVAAVVDDATALAGSGWSGRLPPAADAAGAAVT